MKNSSRVRPEDVRGLRAFREDYPSSHAVLVYRGSERLRMNGVLCVPLGEFLLGLVPGRALPK